LKSNCPIIAELPFSSQYKFMVIVHEPFPSINGSGQITLYGRSHKSPVNYT
jgi:magnesium-transporting ATPase (P-type)